MSKKAIVGIGAGCLGCVGIPALLAIGGAAGWMLANQQREELATREALVDEAVAESISAQDWRTERRDDGARERDAIDVKPVAKATPSVIAAVATPAPVVERERAVAATPTPAPVALSSAASAPRATPTPAPVALSSAASAPRATPTPIAMKATPTPAPLVALKSVAPPAPLPKSTPRKFDDGDELLEAAKPLAKSAKPAKTPALASAAPATAGTVTEEDVAVAALFGDEPGKPAAAKPAAATPAAAAPATASTVKKIKTQGGLVEATVGRQIVVQTTDKKTLMGTLTKVEAGWVGVKLSDGKIKYVQESEIVDASEL